MTKKNGTKRSLLTSALALVLCLSMLVGSSFAWFTDSVNSSNNKIKAGELKIDLLVKNGDSYDSVKESKAPIFSYDKWEPGYTQVKTLKIANTGDLALKYQLNVTAEKATSILANVIDVYMCFGESTATSAADLADTTKWWKCGTLAEMMAKSEGFTQGKLLPAGATYDGALLGANGVAIGDITASVALHMQETAGNEYQGLDLGKVDITLLATQFTYEEDSFSDQYDKDATYSEKILPPGIPVALVTDADQYENTAIPWGTSIGIAPSDLDQQLEAVYQFKAPHKSNSDPTDPRPLVTDSEYYDWYCDYVVSIDRDIDAQTAVIALGGNYGTWGWIGFDNKSMGASVAAGQEIPLLGSVTTNSWTYEDVVTLVDTFLCGVGRVSDYLEGATFTVRLRLTNPADPNEYYDVSTVSYTFPSEKPIIYDAATMGGLYDVIANLQSGDTLVVPAGTYNTSGSFQVPAGVTIKGAKGAEVIFHQNSSAQDNIFNCAGDVVIENITFESNRKGYAVTDNTKNHDTDGDITIINCKFVGLATEKNWGVYKNLNGDLTIKNCTFDNYNNAICGVNNGNGSTTTITGCTFTNISGEAIGYVTSSVPTDFEATVIANNTGLTADNVIGY